MASFDFPARHWQSIRTSNPLEPAFATIRHRIKHCMSRDGMLHMMFKFSQCAEQSRRKLSGPDCPGKVITGVTFKDGIEAADPQAPELAISPLLLAQTLSVEGTACGDATTLCNFAYHSNLQLAEDHHRHVLDVTTERYLSVYDSGIPTGTVRNMTNWALIFAEAGVFWLHSGTTTIRASRGNGMLCKRFSDRVAPRTVSEQNR